MQDLINKYRAKGVLIDTNLLLLLLIGGLDRKLITTFKRLNAYEVSDYDLLIRLIDGFSKIITTPHILTEVCNLTNGLYGKTLNDFFDFLKSSIEIIDEIYEDSHDIVKCQGFNKYGLADTAILNLANNKYLIITDDLKFANFAYSQGADVINFNHIREYSWH